VWPGLYEDVERSTSLRERQHNFRVFRRYVKKIDVATIEAARRG
jgi:hypothetical protein